MKPKLVKRICYVVAVLLIVTAMVYLNTRLSFLPYVMLGLLLIYSAVYYFFWKCPVCKKRLGKFGDEFCSHCNADLEA